MQRIEYWLKQIRAVRRQLPGPSVFLVGTHADRVSKDVAKELLERYAYTYKQYGVKGTFSVSCTERTGIKVHFLAKYIPLPYRPLRSCFACSLLQCISCLD